MTSSHATGQIAQVFHDVRSAGRVAIMPFLMAGYPDMRTSEALAVALASSGADILELGVPFSDPLADGPTIQRAGQHALQQGMNLPAVLESAARILSAASIPIVLMSYYNPILAFGAARFCELAADIGISGVIVPDLPIEEADWFQDTAINCGLELIFLVAPTSTDERIRLVARAAERTGGGFLYCVTIRGVTGSRRKLSPGVMPFLARVRDQTRLPLAAGFSISKPEHIQQIGQVADGAIVGSALIEALDAAPPGERVASGVSFVRTLAGASQRKMCTNTYP